MFNFFKPTFAQSGEIAAAGLVSPEFQIPDETSVFGTANFLHEVLFRGDTSDDTTITLDYAPLLPPQVASDAALIDRVNTLFFGQMSAGMRTILLEAMADRWYPGNDNPSTSQNEYDGLKRVKTLMWIVALSPEFMCSDELRESLPGRRASSPSATPSTCGARSSLSLSAGSTPTVNSWPAARRPGRTRIS